MYVCIYIFMNAFGRIFALKPKMFKIFAKLIIVHYSEFPVFAQHDRQMDFFPLYFPPVILIFVGMVGVNILRNHGRERNRERKHFFRLILLCGAIYNFSHLL